MWLQGKPKVCSCEGIGHKSRNHTKKKLEKAFNKWNSVNLEIKRQQREEQKKFQGKFEITTKEDKKDFGVEVEAEKIKEPEEVILPE